MHVKTIVPATNDFASHLSQQLRISSIPTGDRLLSLKEVEAKVGLKRSAIYERMQRKEFPPKINLSARCTRWSAIEIENWLIAVKNYN